MPTLRALNRGRDCFERHSWRDAFAEFSSADEQSPLEAADIERLAISAYLIGKDTDSTELLARAYQEWLNQGVTERAARCALWLSFTLRALGQQAHSGGWVSRARRLLDDGQRDCAEQGYLLLNLALQAAAEGDGPLAYATFEQASRVGDRFQEPDLIALSRQGRGRALIRLGQVAEGIALLDEVMLAVTTGGVSPIIVGIVYCSVIEACHEVYDLRRAHEWTSALADWCASQQGLVPYRGHCLVRRAEILQLHGAWPDALEEVDRACQWLSALVGQPTIGAAFYQRGEVHRLRGDFAKAEEAYREAHQAGWKPQPGLALLRLAQNQIAPAHATISRVVDEAHDRRARSRVLGAAVEIMLAAGDVEAAHAASDELSEIAAGINAPFLTAIAVHWRGAVQLAEGRAREALASLRAASKIWQSLDAPYHGARSLVIIGLACRALGDHDSAKMELDAAGLVFRHLGAQPDADCVAQLAVAALSAGAPLTPNVSVPGNTDLPGNAAVTRRATPPAPIGGLTAREVEVLRLVATGKTNRAIADDLRISEKTVARHISNIFTKLDLSSRAAATAYAYRHDLVPPT